MAWVVIHGPPYAGRVRSTFDRVGLASAGLAWLAVGLTTLTATLGVRAGPLWLWWVCYLAFGITYVATDIADRRNSPWVVPIIWLQILLGLGSVVLGAFLGIGGVLLVLTAVTISAAFPSRRALALIVAQSVVAAIGGWLVEGGGAVMPYVVLALAFLSFELFAFLMVVSMREAEAARAEIASAHAELQAAQERLAESSRTAERLRIARDLHDAIGHQLTALAVNLDVAARTVSGPGADQVRLSRQAAKDLLGDVREVVGQLREFPEDLKGTLIALAQSVARPVVALDIDDPLVVADPRRREALVRCVQEVVTNAARHSAAQHLMISVEELDGVVTVTARDDGQGSLAVSPGHGLRGMAERFAVLGGQVTWFSRPGAGFTLEASMPLTSDVSS